MVVVSNATQQLSETSYNAAEEIMAKKPTVADAQLILQLYDLRRETEMRKARHWWGAEFFPQSADEFLRVSQAAGTDRHNWLRQALGYWGMTASFVLKGVLNEELFLEPAFSGEMFIMFAKLQPILKELREKLGDPRAFHNRSEEHTSELQ